MSFLDQLAFGPGGDKKAWARILLIALALLDDPRKNICPRAQADRWLNLMSPSYWIYLAMGATVLLNGMGAYSRFRLWRIDANRAALEGRLKALAFPGLSEGEIAARAHSGLRQAAEELMKDFDALRRRCEDQLSSYVTPMGAEMYYRYQDGLIDEARLALGALLRPPKR